MRVKFSRRLATLAVLFAIQAPAHAASVVQNGYTISDTVSGTLTNNARFNQSLIDVFQEVRVGIVESTFLGKFGADATAQIGAILKFSGGVNLATSVSSAVTNQGTMRALAGLDQSGRSVSVINNVTAQGIGKTTFGRGDVQANFDTQIFAGAKLGVRACIVGCVGGTVLDYSVGDPAPLRVLGYDSITNTTTFLGNTSTGALPRHFDGGGGFPISAEINALNLSGTTATGNTTSYHVEQRLGGAFVDVAGVIANKFGVPQEALRGSKFGFDYTTVSAKVGIALNAVYDATVQLGARASEYFFSHTMQMLDTATQTWTTVGKSVTLSNNQFSALRPYDPNVQSVSVQAVAIQAVNVRANLDLQAALEDHIRLLELHGHGVDAGPLFSHDGRIILGSIGQFGASQGLRMRTALQPFTLDFKGSSGVSPDPIEGEGGEFIFVPNRGIPDINSTPGAIFLVTNFGRSDCNDKVTSGCIMDPTFEPIRVERKTVFDDKGNRIFSYSTSFSAFDDIDGLKAGNYGEQWTLDQLLASLDGLPHPSSGYQLGPQVSFNNTPWLPNSVPEPTNWAMMIAGFGAAGAGLRRRRRSDARRTQGRAYFQL